MREALSDTDRSSELARARILREMPPNRKVELVEDANRTSRLLALAGIRARHPELSLEQLRELARREGVSINQLINSAVAEKMAALMTVDYLKERAERGSRQKFKAALAKVPDVKASKEDRVPDKTSRRG